MAAPLKIAQVTLTRTIQAPVPEVYKAFTDAAQLGFWFCNEAHARAQPGGHFLFVWNTGFYAMGSYTALEQDRKVVLNWRGAGESNDMTLIVSLAPEQDDTRLELSLEGFNPSAQAALEHEFGTRLDNLKSVLETGVDQRIAQQVLLGIFPSEFNAGIAAKYGVPVAEGVNIGDLVPGLSAEKAGLKSHDVIVEVNGYAVGDGKPISVAVAGRKPGDVVNVVYYRGAEKRTVDLTLRGYPVPEMPASYAELADRTAKIYAMLDGELDTIVAGATEEATSKRPGEGEWNAKEVIAHLLLNERWYQNWIGTYLQDGGNGEEPGYACNVAPRIAQIMSRFPTLEAVLKELRLARQETVALVRAFPDNTSKTVFWWLNFELGQLGAHDRQHFEHIRAALAS